ncbi:hypothetical protein K9N08_00040 [Candidatus Gracilibacteria bacterium]|nr:hypothetical protein [Candidatus Gracilibacteria bacterium]MCF7855940.1 hypothetical protein [Candidatus Gracilibacteria bacterium]MCF7896367.1 hypothetical protein [Candidatus Gracilibacteria bacterium]
MPNESGLRALVYQEPGHKHPSFQVLMDNNRERISSLSGIPDLKEKLKKAGINFGHIRFISQEETKEYSLASATRSFTPEEQKELLADE